jgi:hypothetical protein
VKPCVLFFLLLTFTASATRAQASVGQQADLRGRYFLVVWGYQGQTNDVVEAHTFVSVYRGDDLSVGNVNPSTISWLPATGVVRLFGWEKGRNFSLAQTLGIACRAHREVKSWGPFEINRELYRRALRRIRLLNSGQIAYSMIDILPGTMNCIAAAGDLTRAPLEAGAEWGFLASIDVVRHLSPYFKNNGRVVKAISVWRECTP